MWQIGRIRGLFKLSSPVVLVIPIVVLTVSLGVLWKLGLLWKVLDGRIFNLTTFVLAALAIVFGSIQFLDAHRHTRKMEEIASSMSTRYVGDFPKDLEDIIDVAGLADRKVVVMANFVDYGHYSKPDSLERFLEKVHSALSRKVEVQFLVYDEVPAREALERRFPSESFAAERLSPRFKYFFSTYYEGITEPKTHEDFLGVLRRKRKEVMMDLIDRGASIRLLPNQERLFFWIEDKEDAVFSFENVGAQDPLCFRTRDARLIETFADIFEQNWLMCQEYLKTLRMPSGPGHQRRSPDANEGTLPMHVIPPHSFPPSGAAG